MSTIMTIMDEVQAQLQKSFAGAQVEVSGVAGMHNHLQVMVESSAFADRSLVQQHQMVLNALSELLKSKVHAVKIKTRIPQSL